MYQRVLTRIVFVFLGILGAFLLSELLFRAFFPHGVFGEYSETITMSASNAVFSEAVTESGSIYRKLYTNEKPLGNDEIWYEYAYPFYEDFTLDKAKTNIAILGDSVADSKAFHDMRSYTFPELLIQEDDARNYINFATAGHNIGQIFMQYDKFVRDNAFQKVWYIYSGNDYNYLSIINGRVYLEPPFITTSRQGATVRLFNIPVLDSVLSQSSLYKLLAKNLGGRVIYNEKTNSYNVTKDKTTYRNHLIQNRFLPYMKEIRNLARVRNQELTVFIMPSDKKAVFYEWNRLADMEVIAGLKKLGISVVNMYDTNMQEKGYFIKDGVHLNREWHRFMADFLLKQLTQEQKK